MTFLNATLLYGAAALSVPLIIHILNRSRFRTIEWGAMHLLESVVRVNHKRFHLEQLLLLLLRCAIPVLLALCLARPVLTGSRTLAGDTPVSLLILLDTSYSMDAVDGGGTRFDEAIEAASRIVSAASRGSEVAVILTGGRPTPLFDEPVFDPETVVRRLRQVQGGLGASDMPAAIDEALTTLASMSHARRELIVISDFQSADWKGIDARHSEWIGEQLQTMNITPSITLLPTGRPLDGNVAVESVSFARRALGVGQQLAVRASLYNHGAAPLSSARVTLSVDGVEQSVSQVSLNGNGSTQTVFPCTFETPGSHVLDVQVASNDPLSTDNHYAAAITVHDTIRVVLVDGAPGKEPLASETDYLAAALSPYTLGRVRLADLVVTETTTVTQFSEDTLHDASVVVLANVSRLAEEQLRALAAWVHGGGSLLVCPGDRIDLKWYREHFAGTAGLLAGPFGERRGQIDGEGRSTRVLVQRFEHPALEFFNEPANGDLSTAEIRQWYAIEPTDGGNAATDAPVTTLARLDSGEPLLVEHRAGEGLVVQMATACDADWSDLPLRPFFVPLMQQLVTTMATQIEPPRNIGTGNPAAAVFRETAPNTSVGVVTPTGSRRTVKLASRGDLQLASFEDTQRPGIYTMTAPDGELLHFVATTARTESDLSTLKTEQLADLAERLSATVTPSARQYLESDRQRRHGREIWKYVLAALMGCLFLEVVLQQRFARVRV